MNLVIDIGNTAAKCAVFDGEMLLERKAFTNLGIRDLEAIFKKYPTIKKSILCSVVNHSEQLVDFLNSKTAFVNFNHQTKIPIANLYKSPETLGKDRLAAAIGANNLYLNKNVLSIDVGTCIKYDFVNSKNEYLGGSISLGISMRYKALHHFTGKLPLIATKNDGAILIGDNTTTAIQSGVQQGAAAEVIGIVVFYKLQFPDLVTIITGGGAPQLQIDMKMTILAAPNLVLLGLNRTLNYN